MKATPCKMSPKKNSSKFPLFTSPIIENRVVERNPRIARNRSFNYAQRSPTLHLQSSKLAVPPTWRIKTCQSSSHLFRSACPSRNLEGHFSLRWLEGRVFSSFDSAASPFRPHRIDRRRDRARSIMDYIKSTKIVPSIGPSSAAGFARLLDRGEALHPASERRQCVPGWVDEPEQRRIQRYFQRPSIKLGHLHCESRTHAESGLKSRSAANEKNPAVSRTGENWRKNWLASS